MTNLKKALLHAARAFISVYSDSNEQTHATPAAPQRNARQNAPTRTSNDIPVCSLHGKAMRLGKYGYHCTAKIGPGDRDYCKEKANGTNKTSY